MNHHYTHCTPIYSMFIRADAKYETCAQSLASNTFVVGAHPEVTYQCTANLANQRPPARGLKFRPRSIGGRFFEVGILA